MAEAIASGGINCFRVPSDGSAIAIRPSAIHNDSFRNGMLAVFVANTPADTVAFRETVPFTRISVKDKEEKIVKK